MSIRHIVDIVVSTLLYYSGPYWLYNQTMAKWGRNIPILYYHEIGGVESKNDYGAVTENNFKKQVQWLTRRYRLLSIGELTDYLKSEGGSSQSVAAITFDGGYSGTYRNAFPILKRFNAPGAVYIIVDPVTANLPPKLALLYMFALTEKSNLILFCKGKTYSFDLTTQTRKMLARKEVEKILKEMSDAEQVDCLAAIARDLKVEIANLAQKLFLSWDQVREMNSNTLVTIGSHSVTHAKLDEVEEEDLKKEIFESRAIIEKELGQRVFSFCYPDGCYNERVRNSVIEAGYSSALATGGGQISNDLNKVGDDLFTLKRICMPDTSYTPLIAVVTSGCMILLKNIAKRLFR